MQIQFGLPPPLLRHQWETYTSDAIFTLQSGAFGSGKTLTNAWIILRECLEYPGCYGLAGAAAMPQLRETLQLQFNKLIQGLRARGLVSYNGRDQKYTFWNGSSVIFRALVGSNPTAMREAIKSYNCGFIVLEEVTSIPEETVGDLLGRRREGAGSRRIYATCNPDTPEHYLYDWFVRDPREGFRMVTSNTYDNPYLPEDYIRAMEVLYGGGEKARRYLRGEWVAMQGMVFPDFERQTHLFREIRRETQIVSRWGGLDFGGSNPHCMLWAAQDDKGYVYVQKEWYKAAAPLSEVASVLKSDPVATIYCDHDYTDRLTLERDFGVRGLTKAKKDKMRGISTLEQFLRPPAEGRPPKLRIHESCKNLIRELGNYRWAQGTDSRDPGNEPIKKDDHAIDALRYLLYTKFGRDGQGIASLTSIY